MEFLVVERATEHVAGMPVGEEVVDLNPDGASAAKVLAPEQAPTGSKPVASTG